VFREGVNTGLRGVNTLSAKTMESFFNILPRFSIFSLKVIDNGPIFVGFSMLRVYLKSLIEI